jgi:hypothetical protein
VAVAEPHYRLPANPLIAVLAAGTLAAFRSTGGVDDRRGAEGEADDAVV